MNNLSLIPSWFIGAYVLLFGLCIGSFLNVVILRGLSGEDFVFQHSKCPKCGNKLKWYMNIPLLSYIFLKGKCGFCKARISIQYPIIELLTALLFVALYVEFGLTLKAFFLTIIISIFIVLATTDILETVILTNHAYILIAVGVIYSALNLSEISITESILASVSGFILLEIISRLGYLFAGMRIFGEGDSYILAGIGSIFGFKGLASIMILSFIIQSAMALPIITINSFKDKKVKLGISYILVALSIIYLILTNVFNLVSSNFYTISVIIMALILLYCLKNVISEVHTKKKLFENSINNTEEENSEKENTEEEEEEFKKGKNIFLLMPFGPALIIASIILIFFSSEIIRFLKMIIM